MGCRALFQGNLPNPGIEPTSLASPASAGRFFTTAPSEKPSLKTDLRISKGLVKEAGLGILRAGLHPNVPLDVCTLGGKLFYCLCTRYSVTIPHEEICKDRMSQLIWKYLTRDLSITKCWEKSSFPCSGNTAPNMVNLWYDAISLSPEIAICSMLVICQPRRAWTSHASGRHTPKCAWGFSRLVIPHPTRSTEPNKELPLQFPWREKQRFPSYQKHFFFTSLANPTEHAFLRVSAKEVLGEAHWLKPPTLARHNSNHLQELLYDRRSW